jgi:hypothetical protein
MLPKLITVALITILAAETAYVLYRPRPNRFQPITAGELGDGFVALDTATGRLCRTWTFPGPPNEKMEIQAVFVRALPACWEIR